LISEIQNIPDKIIEIVFYNENNLYFLFDNNVVLQYDIDGNNINEHKNLERKIYDIEWKNEELLLLSAGLKNNSLAIDIFGSAKHTFFNSSKDEFTEAYFTENKDFIFSISNDNMIKFWNLEGELISIFYENIDEIDEIICSEKESLALIFYINGSLKIIDIEGGYSIIDVEDNITDATFSNDGLIYLTKKNEIQILYTISSAIEWIESNEIPPLSDRDKEKYGIITRKTEK
jgi:WD40 repeat protein